MRKSTLLTWFPSFASYIVKPTSGIIAPSQKATVKVTFQALASAELVAAFAKSKQKFMVQYRTVDGAPEANDTAATLVRRGVEYIPPLTLLPPWTDGEAWWRADGGEEDRVPLRL